MEAQGYESAFILSNHVEHFIHLTLNILNKSTDLCLQCMWGVIIKYAEDLQGEYLIAYPLNLMTGSRHGHGFMMRSFEMLFQAFTHRSLSVAGYLLRF